ncbi:GAF domain-containing protein [Phytohabitans houttuyneae]|uniref:GAF domain-containing protein n=1 Tax=Phytohabitans houttuyneae TaxID=1076126 RepID=UPI001563FCA7|nr:GAF domain-containing protein [Phytohabitans houttuyneae]
MNGGIVEFDYLDSARLADPARLAAVRRYGLLDRPILAEYQRIALVAATALDTPMATVTLVEHDRVWLAACEGIEDVRQIGVEPGLCATVISMPGDEVYVVTDAAQDPRTHRHPLVTGPLGLRFYAAAAIRTWDGYKIGTVNAMDRRPRRPMPRQLRALEHLAAIVADEMELRLLTIRTHAQPTG